MCMGCVLDVGRCVCACKINRHVFQAGLVHAADSLSVNMYKVRICPYKHAHTQAHKHTHTLYAHTHRQHQKPLCAQRQHTKSNRSAATPASFNVGCTTSLRFSGDINGNRTNSKTPSTASPSDGSLTLAFVSPAFAWLLCASGGCAASVCWAACFCSEAIFCRRTSPHAITALNTLHMYKWSAFCCFLVIWPCCGVGSR
jgi:hypothetical protein